MASFGTVIINYRDGKNIRIEIWAEKENKNESSRYKLFNTNGLQNTT